MAKRFVKHPITSASNLKYDNKTLAMLRTFANDAGDIADALTDWLDTAHELDEDYDGMIYEFINKDEIDKLEGVLDILYDAQRYIRIETDR